MGAISRGWQAWLGAFLESRRQQRLLAAAAGRLTKPALMAALAYWRADWHVV